MNAGFNQARFRGPYNMPDKYPKAWTSVRAALWASNVGAPDNPKRWEGLDARMKRYADLGAPLELTLEGTAAWSAIDATRYKNSDGRAHTVPAGPREVRRNRRIRDSQLRKKHRQIRDLERSQLAAILPGHARRICRLLARNRADN